MCEKVYACESMCAKVCFCVFKLALALYRMDELLKEMKNSFLCFWAFCSRQVNRVCIRQGFLYQEVLLKIQTNGIEKNSSFAWNDQNKILFINHVSSKNNANC